jgi:catechol 2,3-dioxygenase-like lactoylglutathione lyase family enzyme
LPARDDHLEKITSNLNRLRLVMEAIFNSVTIYARDMHKTADFYCRFFGFLGSSEIVEGLIVLTSPNGGAGITIHQAAKSVKLGQVGVKLSFAVRDVEAFKLESQGRGLKFGSTHLANGYSFANAKDPDKNSVSISSRAYRSVDAETRA